MQHGIHFLIQQDWAPEQALAVIELLDDLRAVIWQRYQLPFQDLLREQHGTVTASLMLRKLGSYPRQNGLAIALRELGRIERTLLASWAQWNGKYT